MVAGTALLVDVVGGRPRRREILGPFSRGRIVERGEED